MKNVSLVLNIVLLVAVGVLFYLHFADKPVTATTPTEEVQAGVPKSNSMIAYINSDSLLNNYELSKEIQGKLKTLEQKYETEFANRAKGLENEVANFQRNAGTMTISQARATEEELMRKRNNLMMYQENLGQKLMQEQAKYNEELYNNVFEFVKEYGKKENLDVVLSYTKGSGVLYAKDSLDITNVVIAGLNEQYNAKNPSSKEGEKGKEIKKSSTTNK